MSALLTKLDRIPPWACRLLARHNRRPLTSTEIARRSGLTPSWVNRISQRTTWADVTVDSADKFMTGCGVNPFQLKRHWAYLARAKRTPFGMAHTRSRKNAYYYRRLLAHVQKSKTNE